MTGAAGNRRRRPPPEPRAGAGPGILTRMRRDMLHSLAGTRFYRHTLLGRVPSGIELKIGQAWPGDPKRGAAIAAGEIELAGELVHDPVSALVSGRTRARNGWPVGTALGGFPISLPAGPRHAMPPANWCRAG